jgi:transposase
VKWIHPQFENYSCCFGEVAGRLMEEITCEAVGRLLGTDSATLWRLDQFRMKLMLKRFELPKNIDLSHLSADEVHFKTERIENREGLWEKRWDIKYITNLVCYSEGKVLWNEPGRDATSLHHCLDTLTRGQKDQVKYFAVDMHEPFIAALNDKLPNTTIVIDRFHLAKKINEAFDSVRKSEFKKAKEQKDEFGLSMLHPHRRFILVSRDKKLSEPEKQSLEKLRKINQHINDGMLVVEQFHQALDKATVEGFRKSLQDWYKLVRESGLTPFKKAALTIRKYRKAIEAYIASGLTSSVSEGLNNKIKTLKRMGYGYTNQQSFRRKILQRCGYLNSTYINTNDFFFSIKNPAV